MAKKKKNDTSEADHLMVMMEAMMAGVTPEEYGAFYKMANDIANSEMGRYIAEHTSDDDIFFMPKNVKRSRKSAAKPLKDAAEKTLTLKVQMQDVTKPPMWRELRVPADFTFEQLHQAIQASCGFDDAHLWQFQRRAYDPELEIGIPGEGFDSIEPGLDEWTDDARETGLTAYLAAKGDKLVYVYDFGDDWIFNVTVADIGPRDGDVAVCTRWKSDLQPIEDCGGVWSYLKMRDVMAAKDTLKAREKRDAAEELGYESFDDLMEVIDDVMFDLKAVNEALAEI